MAEEAKIIRLYHYTSAKYAEEFLREDKIKLCDLTKSNDLCEFTPRIVTNETSHGGVFNMEVAVASSSEAIVDSFRKSCPAIVLSFSTRISSSAVWGHYADKNKGVCLVFDLPICDIEKHKGVLIGNLKGSSETLFQRVHYTENRFKLDATECVNFVESVYHDLCAAISYKSEDWKYEKECRLVFYLTKESKSLCVKNGMFFAKGLRQYLSGIVLGPKCPLSNIYFKAIAQELKEEDNFNDVYEKLSAYGGVERASLDEAKLSIKSAHYSDTDFEEMINCQNNE